MTIAGINFDSEVGFGISVLFSLVSASMSTEASLARYYFSIPPWQAFLHGVSDPCMLLTHGLFCFVLGTFSLA
jgi:hypothetical protein